jgi:hypothetical protein
MHKRDHKCVYKLPIERVLLEDLYADWRILLELILKIQGGGCGLDSSG